jgi:hypothetical protein
MGLAARLRRRWTRAKAGAGVTATPERPSLLHQNHKPIGGNHRVQPVVRRPDGGAEIADVGPAIDGSITRAILGNSSFRSARSSELLRAPHGLHAFGFLALLIERSRMGESDACLARISTPRGAAWDRVASLIVAVGGCCPVGAGAVWPWVRFAHGRGRRMLGGCSLRVVGFFE